MASNEDVPPLEDMSEMLKQAEALKELKPKHSQKEQPQKKSSTTDPDSRKEENISEIYNRKDSVKSNTENLDSETTQTKAKNGGFGGLQKGFLFGGNTKPKTVETDVGSVKESQSDKKASTIEEIPFITKRDKDETGELKLPEVQAKISEASEKLLGDKAWVTDDLLKVLEKNEALSKGFQNPEYTKIIGEFQRDPQGAMEKYKEHQEFQAFFKEFCQLMGDHFSNLPMDDKLPELSDDDDDTPDPEIKAVPPDEGAQMSVLSSTNPKQATAEDERKIEEILANPEMQTVIKDPKIAELFQLARNDPEAAQRMVHDGDWDFKQKVQKLVSAGLLEFQV